MALSVPRPGQPGAQQSSLGWGEGTAWGQPAGLTQPGAHFLLETLSGRQHRGREGKTESPRGDGALRSHTRPLRAPVPAARPAGPARPQGNGNGVGAGPLPHAHWRGRVPEQGEPEGPGMDGCSCSAPGVTSPFLPGPPVHQAGPPWGPSHCLGGLVPPQAWSHKREVGCVPWAPWGSAWGWEQSRGRKRQQSKGGSLLPT